jgi:hypothetical protein
MEFGRLAHSDLQLVIGNESDFPRKSLKHWALPFGATNALLAQTHYLCWFLERARFFDGFAQFAHQDQTDG